MLICVLHYKRFADSVLDGKASVGFNISITKKFIANKRDGFIDLVETLRVHSDSMSPDEPINNVLSFPCHLIHSLHSFDGTSVLRKLLVKMERTDTITFSNSYPLLLCISSPARQFYKSNFILTNKFFFSMKTINIISLAASLVPFHIARHVISVRIFKGKNSVFMVAENFISQYHPHLIVIYLFT